MAEAAGEFQLFFCGSSNQRPVQLTQSELTSKPPDVTRKIKQLQCCPLRLFERELCTIVPGTRMFPGG